MSAISLKAGKMLHCGKWSDGPQAASRDAKKGRRKLAPRRDATRSHATLTAVACCPYSGSEA